MEFPLAMQPLAQKFPKTVLLVEDDERVRTLGWRILNGLGLTIIEAANGEEALQIVDRHEAPIHLLLTDVMMPGITGRELAVEVRSRRPDIRVLYISGEVDRATLEAMGLEPGDAFVAKPFTPAELVLAVKAALTEEARAPAGAAPSEGPAAGGDGLRRLGVMANAYPLAVDGEDVVFGIVSGPGAAAFLAAESRGWSGLLAELPPEADPRDVGADELRRLYRGARERR